MSTKTETVLAYLDAAFNGDYDTLAGVVSPEYVWIDRFRQIRASAAEELAEVVEDDKSSNDRRLEVERIVETVDGQVLLQGVATATHTGPLAGFPPSNRQATVAFCEIFTFDDEGRILIEDCYQDLAGWMADWGIIEPLPKVLYGFRGQSEQ